MIKTFEDYHGDISEQCDVCVIGSGAGGAVAAKEIAEQGYSVILLEEGGYYTNKEWNGKPLWALMNMYRSGGTTGTFGNPFISLTLGKCVGGTTTVNSATCFRTPDKILEKWQEELGLRNLTARALNPHFKKVEKTINVTRLPWNVLGKNGDIIRRGSRKLGLTCQPLKHNVKDCKGYGSCQFGCRENAKQSMDITYIPLARKYGARIYANCKAERITANNGAVTGVEASVVDPINAKPVYRVIIRSRAVVCSCGTMYTPMLLRKSGLRNRYIGKNLQIHPAGRIVALMKEKVDGWKGVSQGAYVNDFENEGIMLEGVFVHPSLLLAAMPGIGIEHKKMALQYRNLAAFGAMVHDSTTGKVRSLGRGRSMATYFINKSDEDKMKRGIAYTARIFFAAGAEKVFTSISKMPVLNSMEDVERLLRKRIKPNQIETMAFHPLGTCRMAESPGQGAVNSRGETFEVKNLYVADGSIVPTSLGVNPQITIMSLSSFIADKLCQSLASQ